ncbi:putative sodium- and chloride-dependent glycine transporter 2 [Apostichopus japonicus]|uniref:Putative sodium-and chloride-dependent glycine transporter 2 n=1 Tax=Stichopus japonicus TaxID=307972 RepID=A0A2G8KJY7_STIJA|nr:putative sodium- and chloride-dependent glycine transporter 2 [Apostichopus japonicus]
MSLLLSHDSLSSQDSYMPVLFHAISILLASLSVLWSVKSIELVNSIVVPFFLVLIFITFVWSLTLEYAGRGIAFMFSPDWGEFANPRMWVDAISQNAFDTGAAGGLFVTYATFMTADNGVVRYGRLVPIGNNLISLTCGMLTFSTVFSTQYQAGKNETEILEILQDNGPANTGLTFVWFPILYRQISGGRILALMFFFSLAMAGFSSLVAQIEMLVHNVVDLGAQRIPATIGSCCAVFLLGLGSALNLNFLENQDFVWGFALLISGLMLLYLVIRYGVRNYRQTLYNNYSTDDWHLGILWQLLIKFVAPVEGLVLIIWWTVDTIATSTEKHPWYGFSPESFMATFVQWVGWLAILFIANRLVLRYHNRGRTSLNDEERTPLPKEDELGMSHNKDESQQQYDTFQSTESAH